MQPPVTIERQLECARRELGYRKRVYARRVAEGKMSQRQATDEEGAMAAIVETLEGLVAKERLL